MLLDYDKENIVSVSVSLQDFESEAAYANIVIVNRNKITNAEEQDRIRDLVSEYLDLDAHTINLIYTDRETL